MRVVIAGLGQTASLLASKLAEEDHDVTVIDWNPDAFDVLSDDFPGHLVEGNALDTETLRRAEIDQADVFVAATEGDNRNIMAAQIASYVFKVPKVVTRIKDPIRADIYRGMGLEVECRTSAGVQIVLDAVEQAG